MNCTKEFRSILFKILNTLSEYHPDIEPLRQDSDEDLLEKYFFWVDEYNAGYDPRHWTRPDFL